MGGKKKEGKGKRTGESHIYYAHTWNVLIRVHVQINSTIREKHKYNNNNNNGDNCMNNQSSRKSNDIYHHITSNEISFYKARLRRL